VCVCVCLELVSLVIKKVGSRGFEHVECNYDADRVELCVRVCLWFLDYTLSFVNASETIVIETLFTEYHATENGMSRLL